MRSILQMVYHSSTRFNLLGPVLFGNRDRALTHDRNPAHAGDHCLHRERHSCAVAARTRVFLHLQCRGKGITMESDVFVARPSFRTLLRSATSCIAWQLGDYTSCMMVSDINTFRCDVWATED